MIIKRIREYWFVSNYIRWKTNTSTSVLLSGSVTVTDEMLMLMLLYSEMYSENTGWGKTNSMFFMLYSCYSSQEIRVLTCSNIYFVDIKYRALAFKLSNSRQIIISKWSVHFFQIILWWCSNEAGLMHTTAFISTGKGYKSCILKCVRFCTDTHVMS